MESNHQGLSATDLQSAEPTALLNAGKKVLARSERRSPGNARRPCESKWRPTGVAPASSACKAGALLLSYGPDDGPRRICPAISRMRTGCSTD